MQWGVEEELDPSWAELILAQRWDLILFIAFAALALVSFRRKSVPLKYATLVASIVYMGIYKSQLISIVNVFGLLKWNLPILQYSLGWYLFAIFTLVSTVLWGRLYCGRICAFGALTQIIDRVAPRRWRVKIPRALERRAAYIKYALLVGTLLYFFATDNILAFRYGGDIAAISRATISVTSASRAVRNSARRIARQFLTPPGATQ